MGEKTNLSVFFVVGEESGDALGAKIIDALEDISVNLNPAGLAGPKMQAKGMKSLFDISELSLMGLTAVVRKLPTLLQRINQTAKEVLATNPDVLLLIDSPEFSYRVAKKVRKRNPDIKIVKFVAPSVWAWRPGRASKIKPYIDHILAILPFEPSLMEQLGGPETTYVGHPLAASIRQIPTGQRKTSGNPVQLLLLPGSREGELKLMMDILRDTLSVIKRRGNMKFEVTIPAVARLEERIRKEVSKWDIKPVIVTGEEQKVEAFEKADLALAVSGTVTLELALYKVPMISVYKLDRIMMVFRHLITAWTTVLPNLVADYPFIPEKLNENAHPEHLARMLEKLAIEGPERQAQITGFEIVAQNMQQEIPPEILAARKILSVAAK